jgi:hypothetical protein
MRCVRCRGLMVSGPYVERANEGLEEPGVWRCVNCGELVDLRLLDNRVASLTQQLQVAEAKQHRNRRGASMERRREHW